MQTQSSAIKTMIMLVTAIAGWFGLILQFYLILANENSGVSFWGRFFNFFSFYTIITNILVALSLSFTLLKSNSRTGLFFRNPVFHTFLAVHILIVGLVYFFILDSLWKPEGLNWIANVTLHYATPILYTIYWLFFVEKSDLKWKHCLGWLIYPAVYFIYSIIRGEITKWYPYPFVDVSKSGYPAVLQNAGILMIVFIIAGLVFIGVGKLIAGRK